MRTPQPDPDPRDPARLARERKAERGPKRAPQDRPLRDCDDPPPSELIHAIEQFNAGEHFEQHETLELLWRDTSGPARELYHGILQVGVGLHHWSKGNFHGATVLMAEGIDRLRDVPANCQTVDVTRFRAEAAALRERLLDLGPDRMGDLDARHSLTVRLTEAPSS